MTQLHTHLVPNVSRQGMQLQKEFWTLKETLSNFSTTTLMEFKALDSHGELGRVAGPCSSCRFDGRGSGGCSRSVLTGCGDKNLRRGAIQPEGPARLLTTWALT